MKTPHKPTEPVFANDAVAQVFASYPALLRQRLLALRTLIYTTAASTQGVGELTETLKWGEPAYLTAQSKSGSTIRINRVKNQDSVALYFNCNTTLVDSFRSLFPDTFTFEGNRAIVLSANGKIPKKELAFCIAMALTYHLPKTP
jgi:Domain of unknown function (DU1801)